MKKINFKDKFEKFTDQWSPKVVAEMNNYQFKLVKIQNDFIWHKHDDTDEVFIVIDGKIIAAAQEERFTRIKHDSNYPYNAVEFVLKYAKIKFVA